jgi:heme exporter protein A
MAETPLVDLREIAHRFGARWILRGVSLQICRGEVVLVMGPNGSGKSTLLRIIATTLRATRGTGRVCGYDLRTDAGAVRSNIALMSHSTGVYADLTAAENLRFVQRMLGRIENHAELDALLERVGLQQHAHELVRGFSAGMQRRLSLARVSMQQPRVLLLDEPYTALDADAVARVHELIAVTRESGGATIVVTHDTTVANSVADRALIMGDGLLATADDSQRHSADQRGRRSLAAESG